MLIYSYIMQHEWKLGKLEIVWKPFRVFPISTSVDITIYIIYIYQYGKMFYIFSYNIAQRNMKKEIFRACMLTLSCINTALSQSAFRIYKCYIIKIFISLIIYTTNTNPAILYRFSLTNLFL